MNYWEDFRSKGGFSDGDAVPPDAEMRRYIYIVAMNKILQKNNSAVRLVAWDRGGMHNSCLIDGIPATLLNDEELARWNMAFRPGFSPDQIGRIDDLIPRLEAFWETNSKAPYDDMFQEAYDEARELCLDDYVIVTTSLAPEFDAVLAEIK